MKEQWQFNVSVGSEAQEITMVDLMQLAKQYQNQNEYEKAYVCLERAASASYLPAKLCLARLLRDTARLEKTQAERFTQCEQLLLELERATDQEEVLAQVYFELSALYEKMSRPISCLAYLLRSRRYGRKIDEKVIAEYRRKIHQQIDINKLSDDVQGCYVLGVECSKDDTTIEHAIYFLEESVQNGDPYGLAALELGELLESYPKNKEYYSKIANKYFKIAAERGNPQYFTVKRNNL